VNDLKVAHHGSKNATSEEFLQVVHPDMAMISAGINNMYKHPSEELLNRLAVTIPLSSVYRTDLQGEITICHKKGGDDYRVKTFSGGTTEVFSASKRRSLGSEATEVPKK
jgi:beta-lactamase superfamily II metal-dependent hydrolase